MGMDQVLSNSNNVVKNHEEQIGLFEKIAYGGGDLASNLILVLSSSFITFFYTDALGLNAGIIGAILMFSRLFDGISDVIMGFVMDKTKSKHGKARPWILWLTFPISIALILLFLVPNTSDLGKYIYIAITYNLVTTVCYTMINIPYGALTSLLSRDQNQRMVINIFRMFMAQIGSLLINAGTLPLVNAAGGTSNQKSWIIVAIIYSVLASIIFLTCFFGTKERVQVSSKSKDTLTIGKSLSYCLKNNYWLVIVIVFVCFVLSASMAGVTGTYYAKYFLGNESYAGFLAAVGIIPGLLIMPALASLSRKIGKRNVSIIGCLITLLGQILMLFNPLSFTWLMVCSLIKGIGSGCLAGTLFAMVADTIEYGHWKTGTRVEGMLYSSTTFGAKIGGGAGSAIAMFFLGKFGYDGLASVQSDAVMELLKIFFLYVPIAFGIILPLLYTFYKLDKIYPQVMKDLRIREEKI